MLENSRSYLKFLSLSFYFDFLSLSFYFYLYLYLFIWQSTCLGLSCRSWPTFMKCNSSENSEALQYHVYFMPLGFHWSLLLCLSYSRNFTILNRRRESLAHKDEECFHQAAKILLLYIFLTDAFSSVESRGRVASLRPSREASTPQTGAACHAIPLAVAFFFFFQFQLRRISVFFLGIFTFYYQNLSLCLSLNMICIKIINILMSYSA